MRGMEGGEGGRGKAALKMSVREGIQLLQTLIKPYDSLPPPLSRPHDISIRRHIRRDATAADPITHKPSQSISRRDSSDEPRRTSLSLPTMAPPEVSSDSTNTTNSAHTQLPPSKGRTLICSGAFTSHTASSVFNLLNSVYPGHSSRRDASQRRLHMRPALLSPTQRPPAALTALAADARPTARLNPHAKTSKFKGAYSASATSTSLSRVFSKSRGPLCATAAPRHTSGTAASSSRVSPPPRVASCRRRTAQGHHSIATHSLTQLCSRLSASSVFASQFPTQNLCSVALAGPGWGSFHGRGCPSRA